MSPSTMLCIAAFSVSHSSSNEMLNDQSHLIVLLEKYNSMLPLHSALGPELLARTRAAAATVRWPDCKS